MHSSCKHCHHDSYMRNPFLSPTRDVSTFLLVQNPQTAKVLQRRVPQNHLQELCRREDHVLGPYVARTG